MTNTLPEFIATSRPAVEAALARHLPLSSQSGAERLNDALHYALFPGGKRWRPLFVLLSAMLTGGTAKRALPAACAIEYLHTSSLILDDLPAMDDAELRRGRPALHIEFGESLALMTALTLLNHSYALMVCVAREHDNDLAAARLICEMTRCVGSNGMIGGQVADLETAASLTSAEPLASRNLKTTALTRLMMTSGALAAGAAEADIAALAHFGECFGAAYQIYDDLLDNCGACETLGKTVRQDERHARPSFVTELGVEGCARLAASLIAEGRATLREQFAGQHETELIVQATELLLQKVRHTMPAIAVAQG